MPHTRLSGVAPMLLRALKDGQDFLTACRTAGISRRQAYTWRERDPDFGRLCDAAIAIGAAAKRAKWIAEAGIDLSAVPKRVDLGALGDEVLGTHDKREATTHG